LEISDVENNFFSDKFYFSSNDYIPKGVILAQRSLPQSGTGPAKDSTWLAAKFALC
jgi:hypothetical protein